MKQSSKQNTTGGRLHLPIVILLFFFLIGCSVFNLCGSDPEKSMQHAAFKVRSFKGELLEFDKIETGLVEVPSRNLDKIATVTEDGDPKYFTNEIVTMFRSVDKISLKNNNGFCARFRVPVIELNDYVIINAAIRLPRGIRLGSQTTDVIHASFQYGTRNSERIEYIWFLFNEKRKNQFIKGKWNLMLLDNARVLLSQDFIVQ
jgi:hypothetical protein